MLTKDNNDWSGASKGMCDLVKEGRKLTWRKSYNDTKNKKVSTDFGYCVNIYEVRNSEECLYMEVRMLEQYHLPRDLEELCSDLFDLSLTYKLIAVDAEYLDIVVERSKDGQTNIDESVMKAMMDIQKKIVKQLSRRKPRCQVQQRW